MVNHARSQLGTLDELAPDTLEATWAVNVRAALLLVKAFAAQYQPHPDGGRVVLFTSGQHRGPMPTEIPYAATKGALHQITATLARRAGRARDHRQLSQSRPDRHRLSHRGPGRVRRPAPAPRPLEQPHEAADVVALLLRPDAATITGNVLDAEGGFRRYPP